ncbi:hypothetical protein ABK040_009755 [Willaertia magna]
MSSFSFGNISSSNNNNNNNNNNTVISNNNSIPINNNNNTNTSSLNNNNLNNNLNNNEFTSEIRQINFIDSKTLLFENKSTITTMLLNDINDDLNIELIVGNIYGNLFIYQYILNKYPIYNCNLNLGTITNISVGYFNLFNNSLNNSLNNNSLNSNNLNNNNLKKEKILLVINAEGEIHFFHLNNNNGLSILNNLNNNLNNLINDNNEINEDDDEESQMSTMTGNTFLNEENDNNNGYNSDESNSTTASISTTNTTTNIHFQDQQHFNLMEDLSNNDELMTFDNLSSNNNAPIIEQQQYNVEEQLQQLQLNNNNNQLNNSFIKKKKNKLINQQLNNKILISPFLTRRIPCNTTCLLMYDIDGDGEDEILLGGNNRNLFIYKFINNNLDVNNNVDYNNNLENNLENKKMDYNKVFDLIFIKEINLKDNQIYSMILHNNYVLIGFVNGGFAILKSLQEIYIIENKYMKSNEPLLCVGNLNFTTNCNEHFNENCKAGFVSLSGEVIVLDPLKFVNENHIEMLTAAVTSGSTISSNSSSTTATPTITTSGSVASSPPINVNTMLLQTREMNLLNSNNNTMNNIYNILNNNNINNNNFLNDTFSLNLQQEIVYASQINFTINKPNETQLFLVTWDGIIYIIDKDKNIITFNFKDRISNCLCGNFSITQKRKEELVIIISGFNNDYLNIYYNVKVNDMKVVTMLDRLLKDEELKDLICLKLGCNVGELQQYINSGQVAKLIYQLIYSK